MQLSGKAVHMTNVNLACINESLLGKAWLEPRHVMIVGDFCLSNGSIQNSVYGFQRI